MTKLFKKSLSLFLALVLVVSLMFIAVPKAEAATSCAYCFSPPPFYYSPFNNVWHWVYCGVCGNNGRENHTFVQNGAYRYCTLCKTNF